MTNAVLLSFFPPGFFTVRGSISGVIAGPIRRLQPLARVGCGPVGPVGPVGHGGPVELRPARRARRRICDPESRSGSHDIRPRVQESLQRGTTQRHGPLVRVHGHAPGPSARMARRIHGDGGRCASGARSAHAVRRRGAHRHHVRGILDCAPGQGFHDHPGGLGNTWC